MQISTFDLATSALLLVLPNLVYAQASCQISELNPQTTTGSAVFIKGTSQSAQGVFTLNGDQLCQGYKGHVSFICNKLKARK